MSTFKELRVKAGFTQAELSEVSGVRQETISKIESGISIRPHKRTLEKISEALHLPLEEVMASVTHKVKKPLLKSTKSKWKFLDGFDVDLRKKLIESLVVYWTHTSTAIEGNTISEGDTHLILTEGLTVSGKSLREHQEIFGHGEAIHIILEWLKDGMTINETSLFELHRSIQKGAVFDIYNPVGKYKVEVNGTMAISRTSKRVWHEYSSPLHVKELMQSWFKLLKRNMSRDHKTSDPKKLITYYTDLHLGFTAIHPFSDGNGRLARLVANLPILKHGQFPLIVDATMRRKYMILMGEYSISRGAPIPGENLILKNKHYRNLMSFFMEEWNKSFKIIDQFKKTQSKRLHRI